MRDLALIMHTEGRRHMYWYNPKTRNTETRSVPDTDEEAIELLGGSLNTESFVAEYERLRDEGMDISRHSSSPATSSA
jgi:predicted ArsR family transcriptional regulator